MWNMNDKRFSWNKYRLANNYYFYTFQSVFLLKDLQYMALKAVTQLCVPTQESISSVLINNECKVL